MKQASSIIFVALIAATSIRAQDEVEWMSLEEMFEAGNAWFQETVVPVVTERIDWDRVRGPLTNIQESLTGDYVLDLSRVEPAATATLKILRRFEGTQDYADWLEARMDYFEASEEFVDYLPPPEPVPPEPVPPGVKQPPRPNLPPRPIRPPRSNPPPDLQRKVWRKRLESRPPPKRAGELVPRLRGIFEKAGMPPELVWLAELESSFNPSARSPVGAVGLYQFMPATAASLGLRLKPVDERKDPDKNAGAAARYLRYLYGRFDTWPLALAAYNAGEGRVSKLLRKHKAKRFDGIAVHLPAETQMYVPKFNAVLLKREQVALANLPPPRKR